MSAALGFDTSNYKTSVGIYCADGRCFSNGKLMQVAPGERGLRQNDALFLHTKVLPDIAKAVFQSGETFNCVGASDKPRRTEGSYMPCFLAGVAAGRLISDALKVPFFAFSHQEGHIAAAALSAGRADILDLEFLAWHLSGGTTELLLVKPERDIFNTEIIGGTKDLSSGQLIDRAGLMLKLPFPGGSALDALSLKATDKKAMRLTPDGFFFSLSGVENKVKEMCEKRYPPEEIAYFVIQTVSNSVIEATKEAVNAYRLPVLCSGGVIANTIIRGELESIGAVISSAEYAGDNAMGTAYLAFRKASCI